MTLDSYPISNDHQVVINEHRGAQKKNYTEQKYLL